MTASVASASMTLPDAGANVSSKTGAEAASGGIFGAVLSVLMQPSNAATTDSAATTDTKADDRPGDDATPTIGATPPFPVAQMPWIAQIDIAPEALPAPPVSAPPESLAEGAGPNSQSGTLPNAAPPTAAPPAASAPGAPAPTAAALSAAALSAAAPSAAAPSAAADEPLRSAESLNGARAPSGNDLRSVAQPDVETLEPLNNLRSSADAGSTAARPTAQASAQPRATLAPESEAQIARATRRPADTKQAAGLEDTPVAAVTSENAPDPVGAAVSGVVGSAAAGAVAGAASDFPLATPGKADEVAPNMRPEIASAIALTNLTQLATRQNPEPTRLRNGSTNASERNGSQAVSPVDANDRTQTVRSAQPAMTAKPLSNIPSADIAPAHSDRTANSPAEQPAKSDTVPSASDDASPNAAPLLHAANAEPATPPNPAQGAAQFPALLDRATPGMTPAQAPNAMPQDAGTPVKLSFPAATSAADAPAAMDALAVRIAVHSAGGDKNFSIRLDPPEFGHVEVNLNVNAQGHAQAELRADRPQTLELLQKDSSVLERALKDAGLSLAGGLTFSLKGDGKSGAWRDPQTPTRGRNLQIAPVDAARANAAMAGNAALAAQAYGFSTTRLDIRV